MLQRVLYYYAKPVLQTTRSKMCHVLATPLPKKWGVPWFETASNGGFVKPFGIKHRRCLKPSMIMCSLQDTRHKHVFFPISSAISKLHFLEFTLRKSTAILRIGMNITQSVLLLLLRSYKLLLSPWLGSNCRFTPSCSAYAMEAIQIHGAAAGCWLAVKRLLRCHPWGASGQDPVPINSRASFTTSQCCHRHET